MEDALMGMSQRTWVKFLKCLNFLTLPNCAIKCKATGKRINQGAVYGLEIPAQYKFFGAEKTVNWAEKGVKKVIDSVEKRTNSCTK